MRTSEIQAYINAQADLKNTSNQISFPIKLILHEVYMLSYQIARVFMTEKILLLAFVVFAFPSHAQNAPYRPYYRPGMGGVRSFYSPQQPTPMRPTAMAEHAQRPPKKQSNEDYKEDTYFFKKYIASNKSVLPDIKLQGNPEW